MSILVAVTDSKEGQEALVSAARVAARLGVGLVAVNLTSADLDTSSLAPGVSYEVVLRDESVDFDEVEQVLQALEDRPEATLLVVGIRKRSPLGKAVLGSIAQRLILEAPVPVLAVKVLGRLS
jgi:nucleotide-binding universal stress UspA family protein